MFNKASSVSGLPNLDVAKEQQRDGETVLKCIDCRNDLWVIKAKEVPGGMSVIEEPIDPVQILPKKSNGMCPICGKPWFIERDGQIIYNTNRGQIKRDKKDMPSKSH